MMSTLENNTEFSFHAPQKGSYLLDIYASVYPSFEQVRKSVYRLMKRELPASFLFGFIVGKKHILIFKNPYFQCLKEEPVRYVNICRFRINCWGLDEVRMK